MRFFGAGSRDRAPAASLTRRTAPPPCARSYPSGRVAACALRGGMRITFHADDPSQRLLASFTSQGDGSVMLPSGRVCVVVNDAGGAVTDESGAIVQEWAWVVHGTPTGPARPVHVRVSPMFDFELKSRTDAAMHFRPLGRVRRHQLLRPAARTRRQPIPSSPASASPSDAECCEMTHISTEPRGGAPTAA